MVLELRLGRHDVMAAVSFILLMNEDNTIVSASN